MSCNKVLAKGATIDVGDDSGLTPLHLAVQAGHEDIVVSLLTGGADVNVENIKKLTPLHLKVQNRRNDIIARLLDSRAAIDARDDQPDATTPSSTRWTQ